jgi:RNA polymerase primary sigma factor
MPAVALRPRRDPPPTDRPARRAPRAGGRPARADASDPLRQYLHEIGAYPLLSREVEAALARRSRDGDAEALDALVRGNLRFVVSVAKRYQGRGVSLLDLISEGNLGLIRAAQSFDETREIRFISYAVWWVRQAILQALAEQGRVVRMPMNRARALHRIGRQTRRLEQALGREPTPAEIAAELGLGEAEVARTMSLARADLSLDAPMAPGEDAKLLDFLPDETGPTPVARTEEEALAASVAAALAGLREREARILRLYFGLDGGEPLLLEQIGAQLGVTRERVRQIRDRALARLRQAGAGSALQAFVE